MSKPMPYNVVPTVKHNHPENMIMDIQFCDACAEEVYSNSEHKVLTYAECAAEHWRAAGDVTEKLLQSLLADDVAHPVETLNTLQKHPDEDHETLQQRVEIWYRFATTPAAFHDDVQNGEFKPL